MGFWQYIDLDIEIWNSRERGVLKEAPLLLRANEAGEFGEAATYEGGSVRQALFTFLCGKPDATFFETHTELFRGKWLVCMSEEWEDFLRKRPLEIVLRRMIMQPQDKAGVRKLNPLPEGYTLSGFSSEIFAAHPFGHGANYRSYEDFAERGAGAAVLFGGEAVASASSFLSFDREVELDVSTIAEHRRQGLADHCVAKMLEDCARRGIKVHWDAQNIPSVKLAEAHGFTLGQEYAVYVLK